MRSTRFSIPLQVAVLGVLATALLSADSVETIVSDGSGPGNPFDFFIDDFNPSLGTLDSMTWSVTGGQTVFLPISNCGVGPVEPLNYTYTFTAGFNLLGSSVENSMSGSGSVGSTCGGFNTPGTPQAISGSGTVSDPSSFIGSSGQLIEVTGFVASGSFTAGGIYGGFPTGGLYAQNGNGQLTVTYDYTPTPEPQMPLLITSVCGLAVIVRKKLSWIGAAFSRL
jgi:hypothetical protein